MTEEVAKILKELHSTGQIGFFVLLVTLLAVVAAAAWLIWLQRESIRKLNLLSKESELRIKEIDTSIKAADSARLESRESQKINQGLLKDQLDAVLRVNEGFRQDIQRLNQKQDDLKKNVRESIDIGLREIKEKLYEVSVKEIIGEIPASFRSDLETELTATSERVMRNIIEKIKQSPDTMIDADATHAIQLVAEKTGRALLEDWQRYFVDWQFNLGRPGNMPPDEWRHHLDRLRDLPPHERERYARHYGLPLLNPYWNEDMLEELAKRVAYHLKNRW